MSTPPDPIPAQQTGSVADESPAEAENKTQETSSSLSPNESTESDTVSTHKAQTQNACIVSNPHRYFNEQVAEKLLFKSDTSFACMIFYALFVYGFYSI